MSNVQLELKAICWKDGQIELSGTRRPLLKLAGLLCEEAGAAISLFDSGGLDGAIRADGRFLDSIQIDPTVGKVEFSVAEATLRICGSVDLLAILASRIEFLCESADLSQFQPQHSHEEYFSDHPYLAPTSIPTVICVELSA